MSKTNKTTYDVFVSHTHRDAPLARQVADTLRSFDLTVFVDFDENRAVLAKDLEATVWEAMAESNAVVAIVPEDPNDATLAFEMGAAKAWSKPVYAIVSRSHAKALPPAFHDIQVLPLSRLEEVAREIARSSEPLSEIDLRHLTDAYSAVGLSVDQLAMQPHHLTELSDEFYDLTKRRIPGERLLSHLLRVRKRGGLPALPRKQLLRKAN